VSHSGNQRPQSLTQTPGPTRRTTPVRQPASPPVRQNTLEPIFNGFDTGVMISILNGGVLGYAAASPDR
jgi:hypothetical protein